MVSGETFSFMYLWLKPVGRIETQLSQPENLGTEPGPRMQEAASRALSGDKNSRSYLVCFWH